MGKHPWRWWTVSAALAGTVGVLVWFVASSDAEPPSAAPAISAAALREASLTVAMSTVGRFGNGYSWHLSVNSARQAELTIDTPYGPTRRQFTVSERQWEELRRALIEERFFGLSEEYGEIVPDGSTDSITIAAGGVSRSVRLHFLMNWVHGDRAKLREPARAVRVGLAIRGWFDDSEAVDLRRYDRMVLDAAGRDVDAESTAEPASSGDQPQTMDGDAREAADGDGPAELSLPNEPDRGRER